MNWTALLDPANGGPGEAPGYRETLARLKAQPYVKPADRPKPEKPKRKATQAASPAVGERAP